MLSNTGSTETVVKYVVYRLPAIAAILFYWITMKAVQQLTGPMDRPIRPMSCWTRPWKTNSAEDNTLRSLTAASIAGPVRPMPDKYAFQATDKQTNEQTNRRTSALRRGLNNGALHAVGQ